MLSPLKQGKVLGHNPLFEAPSFPLCLQLSRRRLFPVGIKCGSPKTPVRNHLVPSYPNGQHWMSSQGAHHYFTSTPGGWNIHNPGARRARDAPTSKKEPPRKATTIWGPSILHPSSVVPSGDVPIGNSAETCEIPLKSKKNHKVFISIQKRRKRKEFKGKFYPQHVYTLYA